MDDSLLREFEKTCRALKKEANDTLRWSWDERFDTVIATVPAESQKKVLPILKNRFSGNWDGKSLEKAPGNMIRIAELAGDLDKGQVLYASDPRKDVLMIGMWWPWNDGATASFRIGLVPQKPGVDQEKIDAALKSWFGA